MKISPAEQQEVGDFFDRHLDDLVRRAYLLTGSKADAEDLVMAVFVECLPRWSGIRGDQIHYVNRALTNRFLKRRASTIAEAKKLARYAGERFDQQPGPEHEWDLVTAIRALPPKLRVVILLAYYCEYTVPEIAKIMNRPQRTIRNWKQAAVSALQGTLQQRDPIDPASRSRGVSDD